MSKFLDFLGDALGGAVPVVGGLLQGLFQRQSDRLSVQDSLRANMELAKFQYSKDLEMWNRANEYNLPANQMERFKAAGLNPNLIYGQGNLAVGQLPKFNAPSAQYNYKPIVDIPSLLSQFQDFQVKQAQIDNLKSQNKVIEQTAVQKDFANQFFTESWMDRLHGITNKRHLLYEQYAGANLKNELLLKQINELFPYQLEFAKGKTAYQQSQINKMMFDTEKVKADTEFTKLKTEWYLTQMFGKMAADAIKLIPGIGRFSTGGSVRKGKAFDVDYRTIGRPGSRYRANLETMNEIGRQIYRSRK